MKTLLWRSPSRQLLWIIGHRTDSVLFYSTFFSSSFCFFFFWLFFFWLRMSRSVPRSTILNQPQRKMYTFSYTHQAKIDICSLFCLCQTFGYDTKLLYMYTHDTRLYPIQYITPKKKHYVGTRTIPFLYTCIITHTSIYVGDISM